MSRFALPADDAARQQRGEQADDEANRLRSGGKGSRKLVETMEPRVLNPIAEMVGIFDDGASPKDTAAYLRELLAAKR